MPTSIRSLIMGKNTLSGFSSLTMPHQDSPAAPIDGILSLIAELHGIDDFEIMGSLKSFNSSGFSVTIRLNKAGSEVTESAGAGIRPVVVRRLDKLCALWIIWRALAAIESGSLDSTGHG